MTTVDDRIEVEAPISMVYNQWTQFEEFPRFMQGVESVTQVTDTKLHWTASIAGVTRVKADPAENGLVTIEVDSEQGHDVRRELAAAVVTRGWGLLELRPMRMSLEDIFLSLTTEDAGTAGAAAPALEPEEAARA